MAFTCQALQPNQPNYTHLQAQLQLIPCSPSALNISLSRTLTFARLFYCIPCVQDLPDFSLLTMPASDLPKCTCLLSPIMCSASAFLASACFAGFNSSHLRPRDCVWAIKLKIGLFAECCWCKNKGYYQRSLISRVLLLGPKYTHYSTIWPDMDPAEQTPCHLSLAWAYVEGVLQQHEAQVASNTAEAWQLSSALERALTLLTTQV